ncbi:MAG: ribosome rescue protein RqcH, partial [Candidatus Hodarchaeota archaeon]
NRPNFVVVGEQNQVISALWYKKMRHRDLLPGKQFELPPSRGKPVLNMNYDEINEIVRINGAQTEEIVRTLAQKAGGGGELMEEILSRAEIQKNKKNRDISEEEIEKIVQAINEIKNDLQELQPSISLDRNETPISFHPIDMRSISGKLRYFENFSSAVDYYYSQLRLESSGTTEYNRKKKKLLKVLEAQERTISQFEKQKTKYKELGDKIFLHFDAIDELLTTIMGARKKNIDWPEIEVKLCHAKEKGIDSAQILEKISPDRGTVHIKLDSEIIEVDFRKSTSDIANEYYQRSKKAARKIVPAKEAINETKKKIGALSENITEQAITDSVSLKRRKRKWYEKYHWTQTKNGFIIIGGKDISSNEEIAKKRMKEKDLFFHAELRGAPYTILIHESSNNNFTKNDIAAAAHLAAVFSSAWKTGYGAVDVYYVLAENVSFTAPSGEYLPKGGIMVRGTRNYVKGVDMAIAIGTQINEFNAKVIYGLEEEVRIHSPITVIIKPGSTPKGKIAKKIRDIFIKKAKSTEEKAKIQAIDFNEYIQAIPSDSIISKVENNMLEANDGTFT